MELNDKNIPVVFKGLSDQHRIKILDILQNGEECNCNLSEKMKMPLSTLAHHLKVLSNANLVIPRKKGKWTYYTINKAQFNEAIELLKYYS